MKKHHRPDLPDGYRELWLDADSKLLLPELVAADFRLQLQAREEAREEERRAAHRELQQSLVREVREGREKAAAEKPAEAESPAAQYPDEAPAGWYRVLPDFRALCEADDDATREVGIIDGDYRARRRVLREQLIKKGPDRRVASPPAWRERLAELEATLPNFGGPIQLLRHAFALAEATNVPVRVPPMLLLGPPGVGKTFFTHRVAELLGAPRGTIAFDQPSAGAQLRGTEKYWSNSETGLLFNLLCLGEVANPVVLLDEIDKAQSGSSARGVEPLAQLHGALEPETARRTMDVSAEIEFDASLVTYVATANGLNGLTLPILSRLEVFDIQPCRPTDSVGVAATIVRQVLERYGLQGRLSFDAKGLLILAHMTPRYMHRTVEKLVAQAVATRQDRITEAELWAVVEPDAPRLH